MQREKRYAQEPVVIRKVYDGYKWTDGSCYLLGSSWRTEEQAREFLEQTAILAKGEGTITGYFGGYWVAEIVLENEYGEVCP